MRSLCVVIVIVLVIAAVETAFTLLARTYKKKPKQKNITVLPPTQRSCSMTQCQVRPRLGNTCRVFADLKFQSLLTNSTIYYLIGWLQLGLDFHLWTGKAIFILQRALRLKILKSKGNFSRSTKAKTRGNGWHGLHSLCALSRHFILTTSEAPSFAFARVLLQFLDSICKNKDIKEWHICCHCH